MNTILNQGLWVVSGLFLFAVAWVRFNKPPTNRSGTTFLLFYSGIVFYYALLVALWLLVILILVGGGHGLDWVGQTISNSLKAHEQLSPAIPVVAALMITVASQFKYVRKLDTAARQFCMALAAIPREADQLAMELAQSAEFVANQKLIEAVKREIVTNIGPKAVNFNNDGTLSSRFTRAVSLYWLFVMPDNTGTPLTFSSNASNRTSYARIMRLNDKIANQATSLYQIVIENGLACFTSSKPTRQMEEALKRSIHDLAYVVCSLIARYVLFQNVTSSQRRRRLSTMGFNARDHQPAFGANQWVASILTVIILFSFFSIVMPGQQPFHRAFLISVLVAVQLGIALIGGTVVAQRFIRRDEGEGTRFPPLAELLAAGLVVIGLCVAIRIGWPLIPHLLKTGNFGLNEALADFEKRWAFVLLPFICTVSIGLLCSYLGAAHWGWLRSSMVGGVCNGLAFVIAALLIGQLLPEEFLINRVNPQLHVAKLMMVSIMGAVGIVLGAIVLAVFPRSIRAAQAVASLSESSSIAVSHTHLPALESPLPASEVDVATVMSAGAPRELGGYFKPSVEDLEGRYVCFRPTFSNSRVINAYVMTIRWDEKRSHLTFEEQNREDSTHTQKGKVYVPDGKPFMNLVTVDKGALRLIIISRPEAGLARGLITTLSNPGGMNFIPASTVVVLRRLGSDTPQLGFVHPGAPDYDLYLTQLASVAPHYGKFAPLYGSPAINADAVKHPGVRSLETLATAS
jgi:hypothetical protein